MGKTFKTGYLQNLIAYDVSGNITLPGTLTISNNKLVATQDYVSTAISGSGYTPSTRTLTINGTTYDLSVNRSWTIAAGVTSFNTRTGAITPTSGDYTTAQVTESGNLYYTDARVGTYLTTNNYATQSYVGTQIANLVASAPSTLDTLNELALALGSDPNFATTVSTSIGTKVPQARTITINGTAYDLSADRSWSITSMIYPAAGIAVSTGTAWGTSITDNSSNWNTAYGWGDHASGGYVTGSRTLTINGTTYDLTANRSWTITPSSAARVEEVFTATANQTTFTVTGGYVVGLVDVYINGIKLLPTDFTATNGTTVVLGAGTSANNLVTIINYTATIAALPTSRDVIDYTATSAQTSFTVLGGYIVGLLDVYVNGIKLTSSEFTATNGTTFVLTIASVTGDQVQAIRYNASVNGVAGSGTATYVPKFTASGTIGNSAITDNGTTVTLVGRALTGTSATFSTDLTLTNSSFTLLKFINTTAVKTWNMYAYSDGSFNLGISGVGNFLALTSTGAATFSNSITGTSLMVGTTLSNEQVMIGGTGSRGIGISTTTSGDPFLRLYDNTTIKADLWWGRSGDYMGINSVGSNTAINPYGGNVLIGTTTDAGYRLDINGTSRFSGTLTISTSSSPGLNISKNASTDNRYLRLTNTQASSKNWDLINQTNANGNKFVIYNSTNDLVAFEVTPTGAATLPNGSITASSIIKSGGTSSQFLKADGSVDSTTYASGNFYVIDYLVVAGGGGGGGAEMSNGYGGGGAGGGAGGYLASTTGITVGSSYTVIVGAGGSGGISRLANDGSGLPGSNGGYSQLFHTVCIGGGQGQGDETGNGTSTTSTGGSGGGNGGDNGSTAGSGTTGQGNSGGSRGSTRSGGGGGGANASGGTSVPGSSGGLGGNGLSWFDGNVYACGGGGGGGGAVVDNAAGGNSSVNGGRGSRSTGNGGTTGEGGGQATAGNSNTGTGGGGAGAGYLQGGQNGGSGIVIIRYAGSQRGTGGTVTSSGGYTYHRFTSSGTFTA